MPDPNTSWNDFYKTEIKNYNSHGDVGECWFDDAGAESSVVSFFVHQIAQHVSTPNVLDLGTGNGHFLFELAEEVEEMGASYTGIDYSPEAVQLARAVAPSEEFTFEEVDFLDTESSFVKSHTFDVIFDKGTLDAIALNNEPVFDGKIGTQAYPQQVQRMMRPQGFLIVTSCNFTEAELEKIVTEDGTNGLRVFDRVEYPSIEFGGVKGSAICTLAFRLVK